MRKSKINVQFILKTLLLVIILILVIWNIMAIFVVGPSNKYESDNQAVIDKIATKQKKYKSITRNSFKYITYTCVTDNKYLIYDKTGKKLLERKKSKADFTKITQMINKNYSFFKNQKIKVAYGYKNIAYVVEKQGHFLVLDFDKAKVIYNSGGE